MVIEESIPQELTTLPNWVPWQEEIRNDKPTKVPYNPASPSLKAKSNDPETWGTFQDALDASKTNGFEGVGFCFSKDDPFTGIDVDKCRNLETGEIEPWARDIIERINSYTEISPSGRGIHILVKGNLPPGSRRKGQVEMYDCGRYFTVTGQHLEGTPTTIEDRQAELEALHAQQFPQVVRVTQQGRQESVLSDGEILSLANRSEKFDGLWEGDWRGPGYDSESEADLALCAILARHSQDPKQIDRLFRQSGLIRPKWERQDYRERTIEKALSSQAPQAPIGNRRLTRPSLSNPQSAADLEHEHFPDPTWNVSGLLTTGLVILAGAPKVGKSWLVLGLALAMATGEPALGQLDTKQGRVCYVGLEDTERRMKDRISLLGAGFPQLLHIVYDMPRLDKGGIAELENYLSRNPDCRLVVIDTLGRVKPRTRTPSYDADVDSLSRLQTLAQEYDNLTILVVHHTRKAIADDPFDMISGTLGLPGTADTIMVLKRQRQGVDATLHVTGRDVEEQSLNLRFEGGAWEITDKMAVSPERQRIIDLLNEKGPMTPKQMAETLNIKDNNIRQLLRSMFRDGQVKRELNKYESQ